MYNHELGSGWKHIVGVKDNTSRTLKLYIDGINIAESEQFIVNDFNITNTEDLLVGFGMQDYFNGSMADARIYNRAILQKEITILYESYRSRLLI